MDRRKGDSQRDMVQGMPSALLCLPLVPGSCLSVPPNPSPSSSISSNTLGPVQRATRVWASMTMVPGQGETGHGLDTLTPSTTVEVWSHSGNKSVTRSMDDAN